MSVQATRRHPHTYVWTVGTGAIAMWKSGLTVSNVRHYVRRQEA